MNINVNCTYTPCTLLRYLDFASCVFQRTDGHMSVGKLATGECSFSNEQVSYCQNRCDHFFLLNYGRLALITTSTEGAILQSQNYLEHIRMKSCICVPNH